MTTTRPVPAVARGLLAGALGTAAMTAWQELSTRLRHSGQDDAAGQSEQEAAPQREPDPWEQASVPAQVARKLILRLTGRDVPPDKIGALTNVVHWGYGVGWGAVFGLTAGAGRSAMIRRGLVFGTGVWGASYVLLVPLGFYEPPWRYTPEELAMDLSYHLAYGGGVGAAYAVVGP